MTAIINDQQFGNKLDYLIEESRKTQV